ncbi:MULTISPECIES: EF-hand domain-containing protein [Thalassospira]|uniref:EF-hand domain-containing protein n=2 Tax=Thalassospira TaxID=168934 RepID=A0A367WA19_9PROT|nr:MULTISPECIES: EF-hand domain-containing protein [Thalassospira]MDG4719838.1 EF-hand domain-containing protein [Thalassospira sp. FZY0004]RCK38284.1 hypothetical protein TH19_05630 [Thalassospira profundimaris]
MSGISSMSGSIAQILSQNSQAAGSSKGSDDASSLEGLGGFSLLAMSGGTSGASDAMGDLTSQSEAITGQLSDSIMSMLLELQETSTTTDGNSSFDAQRLFSDMDTDGDGTLTKDEFMAAAPDDVTSEMSENLWNVMAGSEAESISEDDYLASMMPPSGAMPASGDSAGTDEDSMLNSMAAAMGPDGTFDPLDTNEDGMVSLSEIMAAAPQDATPSQSSLPDNSSSSDTDAINEQSSSNAQGFDIERETFGSKLLAQVIS